MPASWATSLFALAAILVAAGYGVAAIVAASIGVVIDVATTLAAASSE